MDEINLMILKMLVALTCGEQSSCLAKVGHETEIIADQVVKSMNQRNDKRIINKRHRVASYACPWCYHWHVGRDMTTNQINYLSMGVRYERALAAAQAAHGGVYVQDGQDPPRAGERSRSAEPEVPQNRLHGAFLQAYGGREGLLVLQPEAPICVRTAL